MDLAASGISEMAGDGKDSGDIESESSDIAAIMGNPGGQSSADTHTLAAMPMICVGPGLPPLPQRTVERIRRAQYIEFTELPPAKGKGRSLAQPMDGQIIVLRAADLVQTRKAIPDYATWNQCYALCSSAGSPSQPGRLVDLMGYQSLIARVSKKYKWPSWVIYDQNFRQEAVGNPDQTWATLTYYFQTLLYYRTSPSIASTTKKND